MKGEEEIPQFDVAKSMFNLYVQSKLSSKYVCSYIT